MRIVESTEQVHSHLSKYKSEILRKVLCNAQCANDIYRSVTLRDCTFRVLLCTCQAMVKEDEVALLLEPLGISTGSLGL